jgi:predicted secreted hydrolase
MEGMVVRAVLPGVEINIDGRVAGPVLYNCGTGAYPAFGSTVYQYGIPTIEASGTISVEGDTYEVAGSCWFDRQWQDVGDYFFNVNWHWAWMGLKMANGDRISLWDVVDEDGQVKHTWATVLQPDGTHDIVEVEPLLTGASDYWKSSASGQRYPTRWNVTIPALDARLEVVSSPKEQEIVSPIGTNKYEGASSVRGVYRGQETTGYAYVEMVGKWT